MNKLIKRIAVGSGVVILAGGLAACGPWSHRNDPEDMAQYVIDKATKTLQLDAAQVTKLNTFKDQALKTRAEMHSKREQSRTQALALIEQPSFERAQALSMVSSHLQSMSEKAPALINAFADFYDSLSAQQQQTLRTEISERIEHHHKNSPWH